jgi:hypothetical protein
MASTLLVEALLVLVDVPVVPLVEVLPVLPVPDDVLPVPDVVLVPPPEPQPDTRVMTRSAMDMLLDFIIGYPRRD